MTPTTYVEFWEVVTDHGRAPCWFHSDLSRIDWTRHEGEPALRLEALQSCRLGGLLDACHLFPKERLKALGFGPAVIYDPRCGVPGCRWGHGLVDSGRIKVLRKRLPAEFEEWVKQYGLEALTDTYRGERLGV